MKLIYLKLFSIFQFHEVDLKYGAFWYKFAKKKKIHEILKRSGRDLDLTRHLP